MEISLLGEGTIGIKIDLYLIKKKVEIDLYFIFKAFEFSFYIQFRFKIELEIKIIEKSFYIINKKLFGFCYEKHKIKTYALS